MADWNEPTETSDYDTIPDQIRDLAFDAGSLFLNEPTNPINGMIKFNRASLRFQERETGTWSDRVLSIAGGGTGAATASAARTALGLGTMAVQNSNSVSISGGTLAGSGAGITNLAADALASGTIPLARISGLLNAQIDAAAAIAWSKISKSGSSLAELTTRSAADLSSGDLALARLALAYSSNNWTPIDASGGGLALVQNVQATYVKLFDKLVVASFAVSYPVTGETSEVRLGGLPFNASFNNIFGGIISNKSLAVVSTLIVRTATTIGMDDSTGAHLRNVDISGLTISGTVIYGI